MLVALSARLAFEISMTRLLLAQGRGITCTTGSASFVADFVTETL